MAPAFKRKCYRLAEIHSGNHRINPLVAVPGHHDFRGMARERSRQAWNAQAVTAGPTSGERPYSSHAAQPSVDRTVPSPNPPGSDTPPPKPLPEGPGIGAAAWPSEQITPVGRGEQTAGGTDPDHPHLFHLADWGTTFSPAAACKAPTARTGSFWSARRAPSIWRGWLSAAFENRTGIPARGKST